LLALSKYPGIHAYHHLLNEREVKYDGSKDDIKTGYNVWVDLVNPTALELSSIQHFFQLDKLALEEYETVQSSGAR
jgi:Mg2+ and Co2+ transporter CorA